MSNKSSVKKSNSVLAMQQDRGARQFMQFLSSMRNWTLIPVAAADQEQHKMLLKHGFKLRWLDEAELIKVPEGWYCVGLSGDVHDKADARWIREHKSNCFISSTKMPGRTKI